MLPVSLISMGNFLLNRLPASDDIDSSELTDLDAIGFKILTNVHQLHGAACILYDHVLELIGTELQENYYVIPSSTHEVLILQESTAKHCPSLSDMIQEVNATTVDMEDVLADHPYYYDRSSKVLTSVA